MSALIASAVLTSAAVTDTTLYVSYPGELFYSHMLTDEERQTITSLTLTGEIGEDDFQYMRDSLPVLASLDISQVALFYNNHPFSYTFIGKSSLKYVKLPSSIVSIGEYAFHGCGLTSLDLSNCTNLRTIGNDAFSENKQLTEIKLPASITGIGGFSDCNLTSLDLSHCTNLKTISGFDGNSNLSAIKLPASITMIEGFDKCSIKSLVLSQYTNLEKIRGFADNSNLSEIKLPASITEIGGFSDCNLTSLDLSHCTNLETISGFANNSNLSEIKLPASITGIGGFSDCNLTSLDLSHCTNLETVSGFADNSNLSAIKLPASITMISGFDRCNLTSLDLSHCTNLKKIRDFAFYNVEVSVLKLPASIEHIVSYAFNWYNVSLCRLNATTPPEIEEDNISPDMILVVPEGSASAYKNHPVWGECQIIAGTQEVEITVTAPGRLAIDIMETTGMSPAEITHLTVHGAINETDFGVVRSNMTKLMYLDMSDVIPPLLAMPDTTLAYGIPTEAFRGKKSLMALRLPETLQSIGSGAFSDCTSLSDSIFMPKGLKRIADEAFAGCVCLPYIGFNDSLTYIGDEAFSNCSSLASLQLPQSLEYIGYNAFNGCSAIAGIVKLSSNITYLRNRVFYGCSSLRGVVLPDSLYSIGSGAFSGCESLGNFRIPQTLMEIGSSAFESCTSITSLSLPAGLKYIGASAFAECRALAEISCANPTPPSLGDDVFKLVDNETCLLSIPTDSYYDYLLAQQWGAFVQMRESIDVSTDDRGGEITVMDSVFDGSAKPAPLVARAPRNDVQQSSTRMGVAVYDGASVYVKKENRVTFFISPRKNYEVKQVLYNGEDVTDELRGGAYSTPAVSGRGNSFEVIYEWTGEAPVLTIDQQEMTLTEDETATLSASIMPADYPAEIEWRSSEDGVAEVDGNGRITAIAPGEAEIIASASDGSCSDTCIVTVEKKGETAVITTEEESIEVWAAEGALTVHGVPSGEKVTVYTVSGQAVATATASGGDLVFLLPRGAVYIVVTESAKPTKVTL